MGKLFQGKTREEIIELLPQGVKAHVEAVLSHMHELGAGPADGLTIITVAAAQIVGSMCPDEEALEYFVEMFRTEGREIVGAVDKLIKEGQAKYE